MKNDIDDTKVSENSKTEKTSVNTKPSKNDKAVAKAEQKAKKQELVKEKEESARVIPLKRAPKLLRKTYTQKKLDKKILNKIFIPEDKEFLSRYFTEAGKDKKGNALFAIPEETCFTKKELSRCKELAKAVKKQKGRIRWVPLIATVVFIAAVIITISLTKNIIARKIIVNTCESTFEAKCDLDYVNISFIKSSFDLKGLDIANKNEPMKNLISIGSVNFDFDLVQLLRARFVANELSILDVATNTDRTTSGDISEKLKAKIEKKKAKKAAKEAKKNEDSAFMKSLEEKSTLAMDTLKDSLSGLFDQYNPEKIITNCYSNMQTPEVSKKAEADAKALVAKYQNLPKELETKVESVKTTAAKIANIDIEAIKSDPVKLKEAIETISSASNDINTLKTEAESAVSGMKADVNSAAELTKSLENAIKHDKDLVQTELNKITSVSLDDGKNFITDTFDNIGYQVLGKYYPYLKKVTDYLINAKNNSKEKSQKKTKKTKTKSTVTSRAEGRTVYYKSDSVPKIWIKKAAGSGPNFYFDALDITNDMDKTGKPATGNVTLNYANIDHTAKVVVDTRSNSNDPLITANYICDKLPLSYPTSAMGDIPGIPGIDSTNSKLNFILKIFEDEGFNISGDGTFTDMSLSAIPFEPAFASNIYTNVLSNIKSMKLGVAAGYTVSDGVDLNLTTDVDKQFMSALSKELQAQLSTVIQKASEELSAKINELTGGALGDLSSFGDISSKITSYSDYAANLQKQADAKKQEAQDALTNTAKSKATDAVKSATDSAKDSVKSKLKGLF